MWGAGQGLPGPFGLQVSGFGGYGPPPMDGCFPGWQGGPPFSSMGVFPPISPAPLSHPPMGLIPGPASPMGYMGLQGPMFSPGPPGMGGFMDMHPLSMVPMSPQGMHVAGMAVQARPYRPSPPTAPGPLQAIRSPQGGQYKQGRGRKGNQQQPQQPLRSAEEVLLHKKQLSKQKDLRRFERAVAEGPEPFTRTLTPAEKLEAERWREERKKNYPTEANLAKRAEEARLAQERGELDSNTTRQQRLREVLQKQREMGLDKMAGTSDMWMANLSWNNRLGGFYGRGGRGAGRGRRGRGSFRDMDGRIPPAAGQKRPAEEPPAAVEAKRPDLGNANKPETAAAATAAAPDKQSPDQAGSLPQPGPAGEDVKSPKPRERPNVAKKVPQARPPQPRKRPPTLLQKLLAKDIQRERSHLLQALRFLVRNNFLQDLRSQPLIFPAAAPGSEEEPSASKQPPMAPAARDAGSGDEDCDGTDDETSESDSNHTDSGSEEASSSSNAEPQGGQKAHLENGVLADDNGSSQAESSGLEGQGAEMDVEGGEEESDDAEKLIEAPAAEEASRPHESGPRTRYNGLRDEDLYDLDLEMSENEEQENQG